MHERRGITIEMVCPSGRRSVHRQGCLHSLARESILIEHNLGADECLTKFRIKTSVALVVRGLTKEGMLKGTRIKFMASVLSQLWKAKIAKDTETVIIWCIIVSQFKQCFICKRFHWQTINKIDSCFKYVVPKTREGGRGA